MIFKSPHPDVTVPDISVPAFVMQHAARLADKPAIIDAASGASLTYGQLEEMIRRLAAGLAQLVEQLGLAPAQLPQAGAVLRVGGRVPLGGGGQLAGQPGDLRQHLLELLLGAVRGPGALRLQALLEPLQARGVSIDL